MQFATILKHLRHTTPSLFVPMQDNVDVAGDAMDILAEVSGQIPCAHLLMRPCSNHPYLSVSVSAGDIDDTGSAAVSASAACQAE